MKVKTTFKCRCGIRKNYPIILKRPGFGERSVVHHTCPDCESDFVLKFKRAPNAKPTDLICEIKTSKASVILKGIIKEEEEYKTAPIEGDV